VSRRPKRADPRPGLGLRSVRTMVELIGLTWRLHPGQSAAVLAGKIVSTGLIAAVALSLRAAVNGIIHGDQAAALLGAAGAAFSFALTSYISRLEGQLGFMLVERVGLLHLQRRIFEDIAAVEGLGHLERTDFLDRLTVLRGAAWGLMFGAWNGVSAVFTVIRLVVLLTLLGTVSPWLLLLVGFAGIPIWFDQRGQRAMNKAEVDTAEDFRLQRHLFDLAVDPAGGKEIRVACAGGEIARRQAEAWDRAMAGRMRATVRLAGYKCAGWTLFTVGFVAGLALIVRRTAEGTGTVGDVVLAVTVAVTLSDAVKEAVFGVTQTIYTNHLIEPYLWLRDFVAADLVRSAGTAPAPDELRDGITFDNVTFTYPGTDRPALDAVGFHLPAGSVVAVVGEYGSGKTTLVKLLCKFYPPDAGAIRIDTVDLATIETSAWRERMSAAFQDFGRFQIRFSDTIGLGDLPHLDDPERIMDAVLAADAQGLVDRLPDGLDSQLGRSFDGVDLSEGQWQKTALARASMRTHPLLFLLDEPTASLDAPSEHSIFQRYMDRAHDLAARTGAITVIVSHRFSTVTGADLILVLGDGRLLEAGTHAELSAAGGRYAELYGMQAAAYAPD
jgi:ATP-binding cassette, subfamily B, bacterial